jgi:hypothetical protein
LDGFGDYVAKANRQYSYTNGMRMINLDEVVIKSNRKKEKKYKSTYYSDPDGSITTEELDRTSISNINILLSRLPGVFVSGNGITIRNNPGPPMIKVDGMVLSDFHDLSMINVFDVAQIDLIKDPGKLVVYGLDGGNGVIEIYTKTGDGVADKKKYNVEMITPLGYSRPSEFYSPVYDTLEAKKQQTPDLRSTIYWKPDAIVDETGKIELNFYTADTSSSYSVIIEGVNPNGKLIHYTGKQVIEVE